MSTQPATAEPAHELPRALGYTGSTAIVIGTLAAALTIVGNALVRSPLESGIGLVLVLVGVPIFLIWKRKEVSNR